MNFLQAGEIVAMNTKMFERATKMFERVTKVFEWARKMLAGLQKYIRATKKNCVLQNLKLKM